MNVARQAAGIGITYLMMASSVLAQTTPNVGDALKPQGPIPQNASEVSGPAFGPMTTAYVQAVGRMAYVWGWPLVYAYNQRNELTKVSEALLLDHAVPGTSFGSPTPSVYQLPLSAVVDGDFKLLDRLFA